MPRIGRPDRAAIANCNGIWYASHFEGCAINGVRCMCPGICVCCCFTDQVVCIGEDEMAVITNFQKPEKVAGPGLHYLPNALPCFSTCGQKVEGKLSTRVQNMRVSINTKTADDVFVDIVTEVQYSVIVERIMDAYYKLTNPRDIIESRVSDALRVYVGALKLDDVFLARHEISEYLVDSIKPQILEYGWDILNVLVTRLSPAMNVRTAMNNINIQQRLKVAQREKAEADKIVDIKRAEGRAEAAYLSGQGISRMRQALLGGYTGMLNEFEDDTGLDEKTAENLVYTTQLFDTMRELSKDQTPDVLYLNPNPSVVRDYLAEIEVMLFGSQEEAAKINFAPADQRAQVEPLEEPWPEFKLPDEYEYRPEPPLPQFSTEMHVSMVDPDDPTAPINLSMEERESREKRRPDFLPAFSSAPPASPTSAAPKTAQRSAGERKAYAEGRAAVSNLFSQGVLTGRVVSGEGKSASSSEGVYTPLLEVAQLDEDER